jgi:hypothetical protein
VKLIGTANEHERSSIMVLAKLTMCKRTIFMWLAPPARISRV